MLLELCTIAALATAGFDARLTARRIAQYGKHIELNSAIQWLSTVVGPDIAAYISIIFPALAILGASIYFNRPILVGIYTGMRLKLFHTQLLSLIFEKRLLAFKKALDEQNGDRKSATLPDSDADASTSPRSPKFPEEHND